MKYEYDLITIGLGPAGMAVSIMGSMMDLRVCAIEADRIGGECMNVGCIPSKSLLQMARTRAMFDHLQTMGLAQMPRPDVVDPFPRIAKYLDYIRDAKTMKMFDKVDLHLREGKASFVDPHTVAVGDKQFTAQRIFICAGTRPALPPIEGLAESEPLTNETIFRIEDVPESMIVLGGGAIACEMAQAFARLGSKVTLVMRGRSIQWREDVDAAEIIQNTFREEGIDVLTRRTMTRVEKRDDRFVLHTEEDGEIFAEQLLSATGRRMDLDALKLGNAGVDFTDAGITVDKYLRTSRKHIYAAGDCNGYAQLSHAAMHQGMIALINSMLPWPMKRDFRKFVIPWTVFTEPEYSYVGPRESELRKRGVKYETITVRYADYGAAIAEDLEKGFVKVHVSPTGKIHAACIVGEGSGDMINEWGLAIQKGIRMHDVMMLQHSFPTMSFLNKRIAETWMQNRMKSARLRKMAAWFFRH